MKHITDKGKLKDGEWHLAYWNKKDIHINPDGKKVLQFVEVDRKKSYADSIDWYELTPEEHLLFVVTRSL